MEYFKLFSRVLGLARSEKGLLASFVITAVGVACAQILEPILFGRVIDALAKEAGFARYVGFWVGLGLVNASLSIYLSVAADRFAHRQRLRAMGGVDLSVQFRFRIDSTCRTARAKW